MKILLAHNRYQIAGGEDAVVRAEAELLREHGHDVQLLERNNEEIAGPLATLQAGLDAVAWGRAKRRLRPVVDRGFDVVHVHNYFPLISPAIFALCAELGVPVVHTVHNFRLVCANAMLFRDGQICDKCVQARSLAYGVVHGCYRDSRIQSAAVAAMVERSHASGIWARDVSALLVLNGFQASTLAARGIPPEKIHVKPNFVPDRAVSGEAGEYALFIGRMTAEKGATVAVRALLQSGVNVPAVFIGDGPERQGLEALVAQHGAQERIRFLGWRRPEEVADQLRRCRFLLLPSQSYEGQPLAALEAFATGKPVLASSLGALPELIDHGRAGWLVERPSDERAWADALRIAWDSDSVLAAKRGAAREVYEKHHSPAIVYARLLQIYDLVTQ